MTEQNAHPSRWSSMEERLLNVEAQISRQVKGIWSGFLDFALRDNVLEVAVGLM